MKASRTSIIPVPICVCFCVCSWQTPEKRSHNGYTNLPDVVQPSHSPTDSASHSSPGKDSAYDVSSAHPTFKASFSPSYIMLSCFLTVFKSLTGTLHNMYVVDCLTQIMQSISVSVQGIGEGLWKVLFYYFCGPRNVPTIRGHRR